MFAGVFDFFSVVFDLCASDLFELRSFSLFNAQNSREGRNEMLFPFSVRLLLASRKRKRVFFVVVVEAKRGTDDAFAGERVSGVKKMFQSRRFLRVCVCL